MKGRRPKSVDALRSELLASEGGLTEYVEQRVVSQQIRVESSESAARVHWLAGGAYLHAHYLGVQDLVPSAFAEGGEIDGRLYPDTNTVQVAAFGQADVALVRGFTTALGLRVERMSYDSNSLIETRSQEPARSSRCPSMASQKAGSAVGGSKLVRRLTDCGGL